MSEQELIDYVLELIDYQDDYPDGIDWQELADAAMNYDKKISADQFCEVIQYLTEKGMVEFFLSGWILNHKLLWAWKVYDANTTWSQAHVRS